MGQKRRPPRLVSINSAPDHGGRVVSPTELSTLRAIVAELDINRNLCGLVAIVTALVIALVWAVAS